MEEATSKPGIATPKDSLNLSWRDARYHRFYEIADRLVDEIQSSIAHSFATVAASWTAVFSGAVSRFSNSCAKV